MRVAVIGAGPGGLATLKTLLEASTPERPIEAFLFEAEEKIGGTFHYRAYENAELVSSKQLTTFSDHRFPLSAPDHISLPQYVDYLQSYVERFSLEPLLKLGCRVTSIEPLAKSPGLKWKHRVKYVKKQDDGKEQFFDCSHVAICTGLHVEPNKPTIPGIENVKGEVFHSAQYKKRAQLTGRDVLIMGCGETAMDVAYEAIKADAKSVTMCFRTGFLSFPKALSRFQVFGKQFKGGLPIDGLITNLFETAYVHRSIAASRMRWFVSDFVIKRVLWFLTGTQAGMNQHVGALPHDRLGRAFVFLNKSSKAMPYLNRPYKEKHPLGFLGNGYVDPPEDAQSKRWVDTCTFPERIDETGRVIFQKRPDRKDWRRMQKIEVRPNCVVYCTGYKQSFSYLHESYPTAGDATIRNIVAPTEPTVSFIGFVRPGVGAIPPIAEQQAMWWVALITNRMTMPTDPPHYHLLSKDTARIQYGVDHSAYMSTLAKDFGGAPGLLELWKAHGLKVLFVYCFGASFVTFYRLVGPFKSEAAPGIARTELAETITRRGILGNLFFGVIPMMFYGMINLTALVMEMVGLIPKEKPVV
ncbi:dimethylaniline monooxygenase [Dothidotthia symphoricarpi CBS 119687]|uniref:Dimethylaniline monooxygenase n=1 Tax=Dothidotthia symphoricarpi CBS 119687 TaxID=1392245 RepID=A0A6A6AH26_9PLEO|nr:dimethylaniline monooxygenase [Dothidotthia symphoricarpi CBS 119687]KAF2130405.1 dimethylaniline monooxygenase [Dothidotthia symphoricarpi CBS 119687]